MQFSKKVQVVAVTYEESCVQIIKNFHSHHKHIRICDVMG